MNDEVRFAGLGAYLYGAMYLAGVFVFGLWSGNETAALGAVVGAGASYVAQIVVAFSMSGSVGSGVSACAWLAAVVISVFAGLSLLIGG